MAIRLCKSSINDAFVIELDDSQLDLNGKTVPAGAEFYLVSTKAEAFQSSGQRYNPPQYLGGTSGSTAPYLVTGYISAPTAAAESRF